MGTQDKMEREINLMELFWNILFGWRQMVCFMIIFAIVIGGLMYVRDVKNYHISQSTVAENEGIKLTEDEEIVIRDIHEIEARIEENQNYLNSSAYMQMNPYEENVLNLQYYVESDFVYNYTRDSQRDYTGDVLSAYFNYAKGGELSRKVIEETTLSIQQEEFNELWVVTQEGTSIVISVAYPEENVLDEIADVIKSAMNEKEEEWQQIGSHRIYLVNESKNVIVDASLLEKKNSILNSISSMEAQIRTLKATMTEEQLKVLNKDKEQEEENEEILKYAKPFIDVKYIFLGAFLGIFIVCAWIACKTIFTAKLQNPEEIRTLYNTRLLGEVTIQSKKKRFLSVIDDKLLTIKNRRKKTLSVEQQIKVIAANIALSCKQQDIEYIYITGSEYENADAATLDMLKRELASQNVQVKEGGNIFYDAESLKQGTEIGNMIFVEQTGQSIYDEIYNELNLAKEQKNQILGVVVLVS